MSVYFVETADKELVKIGHTKDIEKRIKELRHWGPTLRLIGYVDGGLETEQAIHARWGGLRTKGEWFRQSDELRKYIANATTKTPAKEEKAKWRKRRTKEILDGALEKLRKELGGVLSEKAEQTILDIIVDAGNQAIVMGWRDKIAEMQNNIAVWGTEE